MQRNLQKLSGIFLLSMSLLTYEIGLTRLISAIFRYHYAFLVVSFAVLGLGLGGLVLHYSHRWEKKLIGLVQAWYGVIFLLTLAGIYFLPYLQSPFIYIIIGTLPFILGGTLLAHYFKAGELQINQLYFADLLGSTAGVVVVLVIFQGLGTFAGFILISAIAFFSTLLLTDRVLVRAGSSLAVVTLLALLLVPGLDKWGYDAFNAFYTSPEVNGGTGQRAEYTYWDSFARTDVFAKGDKYKVVNLDGSAGSYMHRFDGDISKNSYLKAKIGYLPLELNYPKNALLIGSGGGEDIIYALLAGVKDITAVEINEGSVKAVRELADFSGNIYDYPGVKTFIQDGRNFIEQDQQIYEQIYLSLVMTNLADQGGKVLVENYIYTQEAITAYLNHLTENGLLTFLMHDQNDLFRLISTVIDLLLKQGVSPTEIAKRIIIYNDPKNDHEHHTGMYPIFILAKQPLTVEVAKDYQNRIASSNFQFQHMPYYQEETVIGALGRGELTFPEIQRRFNLNMQPVTDNQPFIYHFTKTLPNYLQVLFLTVILALVAVFTVGRSHFRYVKNYTAKTGYFILLGLGFMMIEIVLMQKFAIYLGYPILTFVAVVGALLFSSGIGSYFSGKISRQVNPLVLVAGYALLLSFLITPVVRETIGLSLAGKMTIIFLCAAPLGFFMGMAFPRGIQFLKAGKEEHLIPLVWALNGIASVAGSVLTMVISLKVGFNMVIWLGAGLYLFNYFLSRRVFVSTK